MPKNICIFSTFYFSSVLYSVLFCPFNILPSAAITMSQQWWQPTCKWAITMHLSEKVFTSFQKELVIHNNENVTKIYNIS